MRQAGSSDLTCPLLSRVWLFGRKTVNRIQVGTCRLETEEAEEQKFRYRGLFVLSTVGLNGCWLLDIQLSNDLGSTHAFLSPGVNF